MRGGFGGSASYRDQICVKILSVFNFSRGKIFSVERCADAGGQTGDRSVLEGELSLFKFC